MNRAQANAAGVRRDAPGMWLRGLGFIVLAVFSACPPFVQAGEEEGRIVSLADLNMGKVGILVGTNWDMVVNDYVDFIDFEYYDNYDEMQKDLVAGNINAIVGDEPVMRVRADEDPRLRVVDEVMEVGGYGFAFRFDSPALRNQVDALIGEFMRDGTLDRLAAKWFDKSSAAKAPSPVVPDRSGPVLRMGISGVLPPFSYFAPDGTVAGMDMEMAEMIAERLDRPLKVVAMEFGRMIPRLLSGDVDMIGGAITITSERERILSFTRGYYTINAAALVLR